MTEAVFPQCHVTLLTRNMLPTTTRILHQLKYVCACSLTQSSDHLEDLCAEKRRSEEAFRDARSASLKATWAGAEVWIIKNNTVRMKWAYRDDGCKGLKTTLTRPGCSRGLGSASTLHHCEKSSSNPPREKLRRHQSWSCFHYLYGFIASTQSKPKEKYDTSKPWIANMCHRQN